MTQCKQCGGTLALANQACPSCGTPDNAGQAAASAIDSPEVRAFVGAKHDYYREKWESMARKNNQISWNWAAFFLGMFWLAYRKMYRYTALMFGLILLLVIVELIFDINTNGGNIGVAVVFGMLGNSWYREHVLKQVALVSAVTPPGLLESELEARGGTSYGAAFGTFGALLAVLFLIALVLG